MKYTFVISGALFGASLLLGAASMVDTTAAVAPPASQANVAPADPVNTPAQLKPEPSSSSEPVAAEDQPAPAQATDDSQAIGTPADSQATSATSDSQLEPAPANDIATTPVQTPAAVPIYRTQNGVQYRAIGLQWIRTDIPEACGAPDPQTNDYRAMCKLPPSSQTADPNKPQ